MSGKLTLGNQAEQYSAGGVELQGSPLIALQQTRSLAAAQINNIQQQGLLGATLSNTQANQSINTGISSLTGNQTQWNSGYANAVTTKENQEQQDAIEGLTLGIGQGTSLLGGFLSAV